jgi:DNA invertase Pin-like site-specific DNA recombinase
VPDFLPQIIGYARVSTEDQDLAMQLAKLHEAKCDVLYEEKIGATNAKRPQFLTGWVG